MEKSMMSIIMNFIYSLIILFTLVTVYDAIKSNLGDNYKFVDTGQDYWQSIFNKKGEVVPVKVVEYHSNDKYIIAVRVVVEIYECYSKDITDLVPDNASYNKTIDRKKLQYWLIDKEKEIAYVSEKKEKIENKIKLFNSSLSFKNRDYKDNSYMKGFKDKLNPNYKCILTNNPFKVSSLAIVIDLDNEEIQIN